VRTSASTLRFEPIDRAGLTLEGVSEREEGESGGDSRFRGDRSGKEGNDGVLPPQQRSPRISRAMQASKSREYLTEAESATEDREESTKLFVRGGGGRNREEGWNRDYHNNDDEAEEDEDSKFLELFCR